MKLGHKGHLNTWNNFPKRFFLNPKISLPILDKLKKPRFLGELEEICQIEGARVMYFWGNQEKPTKSKRLESCIHSKVGGR
jgi:hypothetical protein